MKLACSTVSICLNYSTSFRNEDFSSTHLRITPRTGKTAAKKCQTKFKTKTSQFSNRPDLQTSTYCIKNKRKSYESQARSPSHLFTGKSERKITTIKPFSLESLREDGVTSQCSSWRSALWLHACIQVKSDEFENSYSLLYILLK